VALTHVDIDRVAAFPDSEVPVDDAAVAVLSLRRPPSNLLDHAAREDLRRATAEVADLAAVRAVVVHGGPRVFSAGMDVEEMVHWGYIEADRHALAMHQALADVAAIGRPTIAAINGNALGGGLELALACDHRVAGDNAYLGFPEAGVGIVPAGDGIARLTALLGPARAKDLLFSGRMVSAGEAHHLGLVDRVVQPAHVLDSALEWARGLAAGAPKALAAMKRLVEASAAGISPDHARELQRLEFVGLFATEDRWRGMQGYLDDGPGSVRFVGR
jgi:enoyl-CoA hydratase/carnithine racemase